MTLSEIFKSAHALTKKVIQAGDSYRHTFGHALRKAYRMTKEELGKRLADKGNYWTAPGMKRVYFNNLDDQLGLEVTQRAGKVTSIFMDGYELGVEENMPVLRTLWKAKLWFDLVALRWCSTGLPEAYRRAIAGRIEASVA